MEGANPGTNRPNAQNPQAGDPEVGDPEAGYHEYHEIVPEVTEGLIIMVVLI